MESQGCRGLHEQSVHPYHGHPYHGEKGENGRYSLVPF